MIARVQRQLSRLATPDYVQALEVVGLDLGCTAPSLANLAALPAPDGALWPQVVFDMKYEGEAWRSEGEVRGCLDSRRQAGQGLPTTQFLRSARGSSSSPASLGGGRAGSHTRSFRRACRSLVSWSRSISSACSNAAHLPGSARRQLHHSA